MLIFCLDIISLIVFQVFATLNFFCRKGVHRVISASRMLYLSTALYVFRLMQQVLCSAES